MGSSSLERARIGSLAGRLVVKSAACPALVQGRPEEEAHLAFDEAPAAVVAAADDVRIAAGGDVRDAVNDAGLVEPGLPPGQVAVELDGFVAAEVPPRLQGSFLAGGEKVGKPGTPAG